VLTGLDLETRARVYRQLREEQESRPLAQLPHFIQGVLPHPEHPYIRGLEPAVSRLRPAWTSHPADHGPDPAADTDPPAPT
jgi:hypothetical protein